MISPYVCVISAPLSIASVAYITMSLPSTCTAQEGTQLGDWFMEISFKVKLDMDHMRGRSWVIDNISNRFISFTGGDAAG